MPERRMFTKKITDSDAFLDMPLSTQALYFHLNMAGDDDGFVNNPRKVQRMIGASEDDYKLLIAKGFIITFESGVIVIKHWKMHNYIQTDRYKPTDYQDEKAMLSIKKNKVYTLTENGTEAKCIQTVSGLDTKSVQTVSVGKDRLGKVRLNKTTCTADAEALFEKLWKQYPNKRGKGQVSVANKRRLLDNGYEQMTRAIDRYKADLAKETWRKPQNGSTFFNSGYVDYLDDNYAAPAQKQQVKSKWAPSEQKEYDFELIEKELLGK